MIRLSRVLFAASLLVLVSAPAAEADDAPRLVRVFESQAALGGPAGATVRVVLPDAIAREVGPELADLRVVRANGDIVPTRRLEGPGSTLLVRMEPGLRLCFGGRRALAEAPSNDAPAAPANAGSLPAATVGPVEPNPDHVVTPLFDAMPRPTEAIEVSRFSHLRTIDVPSSPDAVATHVLGPDVARLARPDLGDVRVVDGLARPVPFLIRRDGESPVLYLTGVGGSYVLLVGAPSLGPVASPLEPYRDVLFAVRPVETRLEPLLHNPDEGAVASGAEGELSGAAAPAAAAGGSAGGGATPWLVGGGIGLAFLLAMVVKLRGRI